LAIYNSFLDLDVDGSGMLNEDEMSKFRGCGLGNTIRRDISVQLSSLAVRRIFEETITYEVTLISNVKSILILCSVQSRQASLIINDMLTAF
jgi:hypothetical protein